MKIGIVSIGEKPAYPTHTGHGGKTYREWLIGQALCGLMHDPVTPMSVYLEGVAEAAICAADNVLVELEKERNTE